MVIRRMLLCFFALTTTSVSAEQFKAFDDVEVHYIVLNTMFLQPEIAERYGVVRGKDRAIVNLSVLSRDGTAMLAEVTGSTINLLGQMAPLQFAVIREGDSIYYVAPLHHTDQDVLRFRLTARVSERPPMDLEFQQQMYVAPSP